jgi:hypothetical protein
MGTIYSSETSVDFQRTTRRYIPEETTLQVSITVGFKEVLLEFVGRFHFQLKPGNLYEELHVFRWRAVNIYGSKKYLEGKF